MKAKPLENMAHLRRGETQEEDRKIHKTKKLSCIEMEKVNTKG